MNITIANIFNKQIKLNTNIKISGWVRTKRDSKLGFSFIVIYDGSCLKTLQIIANKKIKNYKKEILLLTTGCSIQVKGVLVYYKENKQLYEIKAKHIKILGWVNNPCSYPMSAKHHTLEHLRNFSHLRPRTNFIGAISRIRNILFYYIHKYFQKNNYYWIQTPIITSLDTEGSSEMFEISESKSYITSKSKKNNYKFFGKKTFLTVSSQLNLESYACSMSKVYSFGPTFRAENSNTTRHLAEFWMLEVERSFIKLPEIIEITKNFLKYILNNLLLKSEEDIVFFSKLFNVDLIQKIQKLINYDFFEIEYKEAIDILIKENNRFNVKISINSDLNHEHELYLTDKYFNAPVIIKNFPKQLKAFYMKINNDNKTVASMDILLPKLGEIIGGSQREDRLSMLDKRLFELKLNKKKYWWYRDLRKYGTVPHSGFGLGFERLLLYVTNIKNIRDVVPFPRSSKNAFF
ncbi:asparagine--tRNA ligase [Buchnera aphidicola (Taiwanaphis decaspermi)]|uniref:asparagine--tRNA ligase n=1 Tax=Buchnera aphidicola TaxID=9 RepID=UPI0031B85692